MLFLGHAMQQRVNKGIPPVGWMRDTTEDYVIPFVVSGLSIIVCGVMLFLIPLFKGQDRSPSPANGSELLAMAKEEHDKLFAEDPAKENHVSAASVV